MTKMTRMIHDSNEAFVWPPFLNSSHKVQSFVIVVLHLHPLLMPGNLLKGCVVLSIVSFITKLVDSYSGLA